MAESLEEEKQILRDKISHILNVMESISIHGEQFNMLHDTLVGLQQDLYLLESE